MLLYGRDEAVAAWVASRLGFSRGFGDCTAIGVTGHGDRLMGGAVYHNWNPEAGVIEISAAFVSPLWARPGVLHDLYAYPYEQMGCQATVYRTGETNRAARRFLRKRGAVEYVIPRLRGPREAEVICVLTVEAWRANERKPHGQAERTQAA